MIIDAFDSWSHVMGRTRSRGTALLAASLLVAACVVVGFAGPVAAAAPSPAVFPVGDDAVVTFLNPSDAEDYASRHMSESADGTVEAGDYAGSGYTAYDRWWALRSAGFVIRLVNTPNVEAYRGTAQTAASRLTAITGVPFSVAGGTVSGAIDSPASGEIRLGVSSTSPCSGSWAGCGGPSVSGNSIVAGNIWINPLVDGYTAAEKLHVVSHEFGHVAGLLHYDSSFEGQTQMMHSGAYDATDYRSGDSNGLRYTAGQSQDPLGSWELATSPAGGIIRVAGWAFDPSTPSASSSVQVTIIGSGDNIVRQTTVYRSDVNTTYGIAGNHGFDFTFATGASGSSLSICLYNANVGPGTTKSLGCRNLAVAAPDPFGVGELPTSPAPGTVRVTGWAFDPSSPSASTRITAYVGSEFHDLGVTNVYRPDINATYGVTGNHGFDFTFATDRTGSVGVAVWAANIGAGQNRVLVTGSVTVAPAKATISGRVTQADGGAAVSAGTVSASSSTGQSFSTSMLGDGTYTLVGLPAGSYKLEFNPDEPDLITEWYNDKLTEADADPITVAAGENRTGVDAALSRPLTLAGTVRDASNQPVKGVSVQVPGFPAATTDATGAYSLPGLRTGSYTVQAEGICRAPVSKPVTLAASATLDFTVGGFTGACTVVESSWDTITTTLPLTGDNASTMVNLPFGYKHAGVTYANGYVSTNGAVNFLAPDTTWNNTAIPAAAAPNATIYGFWDDLMVDASSGVYGQTLGTAPNRRYVLEWRNVYAIGEDPSQRFSFQVVLYEDPTQRVRIQYRNIVSGSLANGSGATVGQENADGTTGSQLSYNKGMLYDGLSVLAARPK